MQNKNRKPAIDGTDFYWWNQIDTNFYTPPPMTSEWPPLEEIISTEDQNKEEAEQGREALKGVS